MGCSRRWRGSSRARPGSRRSPARSDSSASSSPRRALRCEPAARGCSRSHSTPRCSGSTRLGAVFRDRMDSAGGRARPARGPLRSSSAMSRSRAVFRRSGATGRGSCSPHKPTTNSHLVVRLAREERFPIVEGLGPYEATPEIDGSEIAIAMTRLHLNGLVRRAGPREWASSDPRVAWSLGAGRGYELPQAAHHGFSTIPPPDGNRQIAPLPQLSDEFTTSQRRILEQLANGRTNAQIADALGVSLSTVKSHLRNIYRLLGVENRLGAIAALNTLPASEVRCLDRIDETARARCATVVRAQAGGDQVLSGSGAARHRELPLANRCRLTELERPAVAPVPGMPGRRVRALRRGSTVVGVPRRWRRRL
jgi:DNA-binding CsgD family transcriptional regulator